jgi:YVTN family beta-propeller protein
VTLGLNAPSGDNIAVIDTANNTVAGYISATNTAEFFGIAVTPNGSTLYCADGNAQIRVIDTATKATIATLTLAGNSGLAVSPDGSKVYATDSGALNRLTIINTTSHAISGTIPFSNALNAVAFSPDGTKAYINYANTNEVTVIDATTNTISATITSLPGSYSGGIAVTPDGTTLYVATEPDVVTAIDTSTNTIITTITVGSSNPQPGALSITPDSSKVFVTNYHDNTVSVISTATNTVTDTISVGNAPTSFGIFISTASTPMTSIYAAPQGRLTLTSNTPVMTADATAQTSVYYTPYQGNIVPIYDGTNMQSYTFGQLTLALSSTNHPSGEVFDVYASLQSGNVVLSAMAWGSNSSRSSSAGGKSGTGNATITQVDGLWVNNAAISASDSFNGSTGYAIPQGQGTYLGSFYTTAAGQTGINFKPAAAAGGSNNIIGFWNAYNRVRISSMCSDSNTGWTYATATWRPLDGGSSNTKNRVTYLDGLGQSFVKGKITTQAYNATAGANCTIGVVQNSITGAPFRSATYLQASGGTAAGAVTFSAEENFQPILGLNYIQGMEDSPNAVSVTFSPNGGETNVLFDGEF